VTTLALFHGWGASGRVWDRQAQHFRDRLTVLALTVPVWDAGWFIDTLRALPLQECLLVGWSLGGMLLLEALSRLGGAMPAGLVLAGVAPVFTRRRDYPRGQPPGVVRAMRRGLQDNRRQVLDEFARQCLAPGEGDFISQAREAFAKPAGVESLAAGLDYLLEKDLRPLLPGLSGRVVIIQGQEDRIVPPAQGEFLASQLAGAALHLLPGAGHLPFLTQAPAVNGIIETCLSTAK
jgi:pimeloyl-[acyl-carrier protein] methyl ester esterase